MSLVLISPTSSSSATLGRGVHSLVITTRLGSASIALAAPATIPALILVIIGLYHKSVLGSPIIEDERGIQAVF